MFKGEEGKKMLKMQSEMGARMMYGDFTKKLDPTTADAFMALLAERQGMMATLGMELMNSDDVFNRPSDHGRVGSLTGERRPMPSGAERTVA